jgi:hypothetical protein
MKVETTIAVLCFAAVLAGCQRTEQPVTNTVRQPPQSQSQATPQQSPTKPLSEIDLTKIGHLAPKGRVQDRDYNETPVIDELISHGKDSIPFLINKLDDRTVIHYSVEDYWPEMTVGDVAFLILEDFSMDSTWTKETIPGTSWDEIFEAKYDPNVAGSDYYYRQVRRYGRGWIKAKWEKIWAANKDRIVWDDNERCFIVA